MYFFITILFINLLFSLKKRKVLRLIGSYCTFMLASGFYPKKERKKKKKITAVIHGFSSARNLAVKHLDRPLQMQHA